MQLIRALLQRIIVIVGTCLCAMGLFVTFFMIDNIVLPDTQSLPENETSDDDSTLDGNQDKRKRGAATTAAVPVL